MPDAFADLPVVRRSAFDDLPDTDDAVARRITSDVFYNPTEKEFGQFQKWSATQPSKPLEALKEGFLTVARAVKNTATGLGTGKTREGADPKPLDAAQTLLEAATRGTAKTGLAARGLLDKVSGLTQDLSEKEFNQQLRGPRFEFNPQSPSETDVRAIMGTKPEISTAPSSYAEYKRRRDFERFQTNRGIEQFLEQAKRGQETVVPEVLGSTVNAVAEPLSDITGVEDVATFGAGALGEAALRNTTRQLASQTAGAAGTVAGATGRAATMAGRIPENLAAGAARTAGASPEVAELIRKTVSGGQASVAIAPAVGFTVPGVAPVAAAATGLKVAGRSLGVFSDVADAVGRAAAASQSRAGTLDRISRDGSAPIWLRKAAGNARILDPALSEVTGAAGAAARGAATGATVGAGAGFVLSGGDPEAAAGGAGGGAGMGALGGLVNRVRTRSERVTAAADGDLARWLSGKSDAEVENIAALRLSREQALKVADIERWAKGVVNAEGGDIGFNYLKDADFRKMFGQSAKGAQIIQGERPTVFINTNYRGPRSLFHEVFHAIDDLDAFEPERAALNRRLFTETAPDGTVISRGLFDPADIARFEEQYRARAGDAPFDVRKEVRAEAFANLVSGSNPRDILNSASGWRRRLADSLLLADHASTLGRMRRGLEAAGVEFRPSGDPSEVFFKDGKPLTNTPEVDAALRDYMRAKRRVVDRLVAGDEGEAPATIFDEHAMRANPALARKLATTYPDWDGWARTADGSVKMLGANPVLATEREIKRIHDRRVESMVAALKAVPDLGDPVMVKDDGKGHWTGSRFSPEQLAALQGLPDAVLPPSLKEKIAQLNEIAGRPGQQIVLDYNAALKSKRYSSGISPSVRVAVPISFDISKAGNFVMTTLDVTHFMRKVGEWQEKKPRAFAPWGGDTTAFMGDVFKYLDNHQRKLPGATDLDADPAVAIAKRNTIKDLFNVGGPDALRNTGGAPISTGSGKDNLIRSRRLDRINRITPGEGTPFPIDYYRQKANLLPAPAIPRRFALEKPIKGPTGAAIIGYEWRSHIDDVWSEGKQDYVEKRVSDWGASDQSTGTGREIVHVYHVNHPDGKTTIEGINSAEKILGIGRTKLQQIAKREQAAQAYRAEQSALELKAVESVAKPSAVEAGQDYRKRNYSPMRSFEENDKVVRESALYEKGGQFLRSSGYRGEILTENGWTKVPDVSDPMRRGLIPPEVARVARDQAEIDFARGTGLPINVGRELAKYAEGKPVDAAAIGAIARSGGLDAARKEIDRQAGK